MLNNQKNKIVLIKDLGMMYPTKTSKQKTRFGLYICPSCGKEFKSSVGNIKRNEFGGCGCNRGKNRITHGMKETRIYGIWKGIGDRVNNKNSKYYKNYGGRGIFRCERWNKFENFLEDMGSTYNDTLTIDRIDNDGNYEPSNCRWTTRNIQARNTRLKRTNNTSGYRGVSKRATSKRWRAAICVDYKTIHLGTYTTALEAAKVYDKYVIDNKLEHTINNVL